MSETERQNKEIVRRFMEEAWNLGDEGALERYLHPRVVQHGSANQQPLGPEGSRRFIQEMREAFPDMHFDLEDVVAEGDRVVVRWSGEGTHQGPLLGLPPSGRSVELEGMSEHRLKNGRIAETWTQWDTLGVLRQLDAGVSVTPHVPVGESWARDVPKE